MQISYNWLREFVKLPDSLEPEAVAEKLKLSTVEVENVVRLHSELQNVVVGKVLKAEKHPQADKLKVCTVDAGDEKVTVVCGGSNVSEGMLCALAKLGARVKWHGEGEPVIMEKAVIRGVESFGMICGADEIGLLELFPKKEEKEIVDLSPLKLKVGKPLAEALKIADVIFEIDNKSLSNRPDLWGHYGIAREVAALHNRQVLPLNAAELKPGKGSLSVKIEDKKKCARYMAIAIEGVKIAESPLWLRQRLASVGIRPINNVVDVTNYVMLSVGQPLHAFDGRELSGHKGLEIGVRSAKAGEKFTTLDGKERELSDGDLLITSGGRAVALAGIMGGLNSEVKNDTTELVIESANFSGSQIRKTSTALNLRTDASARFEKKLDPESCENGLKLAVQMILELCPDAKVSSRLVDEAETKKRVRPLEMKKDFIAAFSGVDISEKAVLAILERLGFGVAVKGEFLEVTVPTWRAENIVSPEGVAEEVLRINGYQNIAGSMPSFPVVPPEQSRARLLGRKVASEMSGRFGFDEIYNYSFVSGSLVRAIGDNAEGYLELDNPLSKERPYLRRSLLPNLLETLQKNSGRDEADIFEIGTVIEKDLPGLRVSGNGSELLPRQDTQFLFLAYNKKDQKPFIKVRHILENILEKTGVQLMFAEPAVTPAYAHPVRMMELRIGDAKIGECYEVHPRVLKNFGLEGRVGAGELNLSALAEFVPDHATRYVSISPYPEAVRDIAFIVPSDTKNSDLVAAIASAHPLLRKVEMFDRFDSKEAGEKKKSVAYHLTFGSSERTLTSEEVAEAEEKIKATLRQKFAAEVRD